jgi:PAS domain S-box-containing protein
MKTTEAVVTWDVTGRIIGWGEGARRLFGYAAAEILQQPLALLVPAEQLDEDAASRAAMLSGAAPAVAEVLRVARDGRRLRMQLIRNPVRDGEGRVVAVTDLVRAVDDVAAAGPLHPEPVVNDHDAARLGEGQRRVLEMIATGSSLQETLDELLRTIEAQSEDMICSVLLLDEDGRHICHGSAPRLPHEYNEAIQGEEIGPCAGSCGTAMYRRESVLVSDIAEDPLWDRYRHLALPFGLRACWSTPIFGRDRNVLGSFAIYHRQPGLPTPHHRALIAVATHLASICIGRYRAERALRATEQRLRQLSESLPQLIWTCTADGACDFVNRRFESYVGAAEPAQYGDGWLDCLYPEDRLRVAGVWRQAQAQGCDFQAEARLRRADGVHRWFDLRATALRSDSGSVVKWFASATEIHEAREAREALRQEQLRLERIVATVPGAIVVLQIFADGGVACHYASPPLADIYGVDPHSLDTDARSLRRMIHPDDYDRVGSTRAAAFAAAALWHCEFRVRNPQRGIVWVEVRLIPQSEPDGSQSWIGFVMDVTARKRIEEQQLRSQKLEALGTLAGGIAHDFNNILLTIAGNVRLALDDLDEAHPAQQSIAEIARASARAAALVKRILSFSRPEEARRKAMALPPLIDEALLMLRATLPAQIDIVTDYASNDLAVEVDAGQVHQLVVNLATNAAYAIGSRPGRIDVRVAPVTIDAQAAQDLPGLDPGRYVVLAFGDDGCGMDDNVLQQLFDPFFTTKPPGQGTGLGLSVVHGIVKSCGGAIAVHSRPGGGATFNLYFPQAQPTPREVAPAAAPVVAAGGQHLLYVDDEKPLVMLAERVLKRLGYRVSGYTDPRQAFAAFEADPRAFDAVITDVAMPGMTGFELARKTLDLRPDTPVVMTSGYVRQEDQDAALNMGVRAFILKPDTIEELGGVLQRLLAPDAGA